MTIIREEIRFRDGSVLPIRWRKGGALAISADEWARMPQYRKTRSQGVRYLFTWDTETTGRWVPVVLLEGGR